MKKDIKELEDIINNEFVEIYGKKYVVDVFLLPRIKDRSNNRLQQVQKIEDELFELETEAVMTGLSNNYAPEAMDVIQSAKTALELNCVKIDLKESNFNHIKKLAERGVLEEYEA